MKEYNLFESVLEMVKISRAQAMKAWVMAREYNREEDVKEFIALEEQLSFLRIQLINLRGMDRFTAAETETHLRNMRRFVTTLSRICLDRIERMIGEVL